MRNLLIFVFCICSLYTFAQDTETSLDPVTITATLSKTKASQTGRDITVIKGDAFRMLPVHSIDELLRYVPGVEIQQRGPQDSQSDILIRGGTFQQVLVVLDGIRLNDPNTGHFNSYTPIAPEEIERIEIVKGPAAAIYGADAVGGVIHIISKSFTASPGKEGHAAAGQVTAGEYGLLNANAGGWYQKNNTILSAGILTDNAGGQPQRGIHGYFHNTTASASIRQFITKHWSIAFRSAIDLRHFAAQNFYTAFSSDTATEKVDTWWNQLNLRYENGKQSFSLDAGYKQAKDEYYFNSKSLPNLNKSKMLQALAVYQYRLTSNTRLSTGVQFVQQSIRSNDRGNHDVPDLGVFTSLLQQTGKWSFTPSLRLEWNQRAGTELLPQLNIAYQNQGWVFRTGAGRATRIADFTEGYNNYNKPLVTSGNIGNPDLSAESAWNIEAGTDYFIGSSWKLSATAFSKYYSNLIDWVATPYANMPRKDNLSPTGSYFLASNISKLTTSGVEATISYHHQWRQQEIQAVGGFTWLNSSATPSLYISSHAITQYTASLLYRYKWLQLSANGLYKTRQPQAGTPTLVALSRDYFVANARIAAGIHEQKLQVFVQCDNLSDTNYADRFGVPMPGRWWSGGITVQF